MAVTGANVGFKIVNADGGPVTQDLGQRYVSREYLIDVYPNLALLSGARSAPGLWAWGLNNHGQVGNGTTGTNYSSPIQVGQLGNWKQISAGYQSIAAIKTDGTLWTCGYGSTYGQLGNGTNSTDYNSPIQVGLLTTWKQVSVGAFDAGAIKTDGTLWTWGYGGFGAIGNGSISNYSSPVQVGALTNWKQLFAGYYYVTAIKTDGTIWTWGYNNYGQLGNGTTTNYSSPIQVGALTTWRSLATGFYSSHCAAIKTDGTLWTWGYNQYGQLGNGTVVYYSSPVQVGSLTNWKQVSCGYRHTLAIKTDGTLWAWGSSIYGAVGNGTGQSYSSPIQIGALTNWKIVAAGEFHSLALKSDGTIWGWGYNYEGQLGNNPPPNSTYLSPIQIGTQNKWKSINAGWRSANAIADGYY